MRSSVFRPLGIVLTVLGLQGCGPAPQSQFGWRDSTEAMIPTARAAVQKTMHDHFGTPEQLVAWERLPVNYTGRKVPADPNATEPSAEPAQTSTERAEKSPKFFQTGRMVYMKNCMHCHGVSGDGLGPTAKYLNPRPRDYRLGVFKFTSTEPSSRVTREDLTRIVKDGIPGTYMPSFLLLDDAKTEIDELAAVVEYVRWLSMRGEMEKRLGDELADYSAKGLKEEFDKDQTAYDAAVKAGEKPDPIKPLADMIKKAEDEFAEYVADDEYSDAVDGTADIIAENWSRAEDPASLITPTTARVTDDAASRSRGRMIYLSDRGKCYTCHGHTGRGDGSATEDFWPKPGSGEKYAEPGLHDTWGFVVPPRNLRQGQYRGGRRPVDVFRRIHAGIKGTPMPAYGGTVLKDDEIWDVVNFVMSLPFESEAGVGPAAGQVAARPEPAAGQ